MGETSNFCHEDFVEGYIEDFLLRGQVTLCSLVQLNMTTGSTLKYGQIIEYIGLTRCRITEVPLPTLHTTRNSCILPWCATAAIKC